MLCDDAYSDALICTNMYKCIQVRIGVYALMCIATYECAYCYVLIGFDRLYFMLVRICKAGAVFHI